ncbi:amino acid adenylation domain-containing protein [Pseudomonas viridiflava]|uniref:non-ribosomal peptide synthetase n=1 Tax=Pseudomonas viridiflava TaxID=33069 RepID=UPI0015E2B103|nr:non-ribosomal peptide synthetase [Pseudomonas viridiflava]MBA1228906.1 amino acid adenylation domain-containing protein [Pseudomonas viridiflava]
MNAPIDSLDPLKRAALLRLLKQRGATRVVDTTPDDMVAVDREGPLALSFAQQRLWFIDQLDPTASAAYHIPASLVMHGSLDRSALKATLDRLVARHESLRTTFRREGEQPVQVIAAADCGFNLVEHDLRHLPRDEAEQQAARLTEQEAAAPFDLLNGPLIRGSLLRLADTEHRLLITQHHIISDGWSIGVMVKEFAALYEAFSTGQPDPLPALTLQYADYSAWQRQHLEGERLSRHVEFWRSHLAGAPALLSLPTDRPRPAVQSYQGATLCFDLPVALSGAITRFAQSRAATPFMTLMAAWAVLLGRISGQQDIVIGTVTANRERQDVQALIGFFVNTLALRVRLDANPTLDQVLQQVKELMLESASHQQTPFEQVVEALKPARSASHSPVFQTMLYTDAEGSGGQLQLPGLNLEFLPSQKDNNQHDLSLHIDESGERLSCSLSYSTALFDASTVERLAARFERLLSRFTEAPQTRIGELQLDADQVLPEVSALAPVADAMPLSYHQERIWFVDTFETGYLYEANPIYHNVALLLALSGELNVEALQTAINGLLARHAILRCRVHSDGASAWQRFDGSAMLALEQQQATLETLRAQALAETRRPLDMSSGSLVRATLVRADENNAVLALAVHHLLADRTSMQLIKRDLLTLYEAACAEREAVLPVLSLSYGDFAAWQRQLPAAALENLRAYWSYQLRGKLQALELPLNRPRAAVHVFSEATLEFTIDSALTRRLEQTARDVGVSAESIALSAFSALLRRYAGHDELVIGTSAACREPGLQNVLGPMDNLLVIRTACDSDLSLQALLEQTSTTLTDALRNRHLQFDQLVRVLNPAKDMSRTALFDVLFNFQHVSDSRTLIAGLEVDSLETNLGYGKNDLHLLISAGEQRWNGHLVYNADFFTAEFVTQLMRHYVRLLQAFVDTPQQRVDDVVLLDAAERQRQVLDFNDSEAAWPDTLTLHQMFEAQVRVTPDNIAVNLGEERLTYRQLNEQANRLAHRLRKADVQPQELVAIVLDRSLAMIVATLAVLKSGAAYVPIDPGSPSERIAYVLRDSGARKAIARPDMSPALLALDIEVFAPQSSEVAHDAESVANLANVNAPNHLCYVIYTSGSTGEPKGALLEHRNVVRLMHNNRSPFAFNAEDVWSLFHSNAFDFSVWEMYGALLYGGRLTLVPDALRRDPEQLVSFLEQEQVSVLNQTPSSFLQLSAAALARSDVSLKSLRYVIFGGESLEPGKLDAFHRAFPDVALVNMYGITETCVHVTYKAIDAQDIEAGISNVGRPIPTTVAYVLDAQQRLLPVGVAGEICVAGLGVGRGYLNRPELTAERFIADPLRPGERLYRSGDLGKLLDNGEIIHLGRMDAQVKIRGFRIELGEIEAKLLACEGVREARVLARDDASQGKRLIAYLIPEPSVRLEVAALRKQLGATLPDYMIPSAFVSLSAYPLTGNGKLDQDALPAPDLDAMSERGYTAPEGTTELALAQIFQELLGLERVGRHDGFFELGGHSLLAAQLVSRVRQQLGGEMMLRQLFSHPTVAELARVIGGLQTAENDAIEPIGRDQPLALSFSQQRLWFLDQLDPDASRAYHMPISLLLRGDLDHAALKAALNRLVARHESLRTTFERHGEQPVQIIAPPDCGFALAEQDLRALPYEQASLSAARIGNSEALAPFDLRQGPLIRGRLLRLTDDEHIVLITQHHIISDGWSVSVLVKEFAALYEAFSQQQADPLPPLSIQYADYAAWQRRTFTGERLAEQANFWRDHLLGAPALLSLPTDRPRPAVQSYRGGNITMRIEPALYQRLERFCQAHNVTLFMGLLSAWSVLMARLGNERDVVIGVPTANRGRTETESLIGFFVNTLALRVDLTQNPSVAQLLDQVRQTLLAAHEHQDIPFEQVIEALQPPRSLSHNPLCQVALSLDNTDVGGELNMPGLSLQPVVQAHDTAQFDLMLTLVSEDGGLSGVIEYASDLFDRTTVERFAQHFQILLDALVADVTQPALGLPLLSAAQRQSSPALQPPQAAFAPGLMVHERFEQFAAQTPHATALVFGEREVTYQTLNRQANRLARELLAQGVRPDDRVAILAQRGTQMVSAVLAVLKAGAAYVPLDPSYPAERLGYLLTDSAPVVVLAQASCIDVLPAHNVQVMTLNDDDNGTAQTDASFDHNLSVESLGVSHQHLAYVIYTSGSTGLPKGVLVEHGNVARLFDATAGHFNFGPQDVWTLFHSFAFDFSVWEIWGALSYGGKLVIVPSEVARSPDDFYALVCQREVTVLNQTPSAFRQFIQARERSPQEHALREVVFGGEALDFRSLQPWTAKTPLSRTRLVNMYGITEITVHATYYPISQAEIDTAMPSLIGPPLADLCLRILDDYQQPVPVGVNGEIYIGGAGVARHYLNREQLNTERFIADPYAVETGARLYRTGDVAHYRADGGVVYVGRNDSQIKIRGFRIELGEIEAQLLACAEVREAIVVLREDRPGDKRLVAYLIAEQGCIPESSALRSQLAGVLAEHMLPNAFVTLEAWPLTTNGKLNRAALPAPDPSAAVSRQYEAPLGTIEATLAAAWQELLGVERVGRQDHFFELGGHSFLVISLIERLRQAGLQLDVRTVFSAPTLQAMATVLAGGGSAERVVPANLIPNDCKAITPDMLPLVTLSQQEIEQIVDDVPGGAANVQDIYPLSSLQEGILFHHLLQSEGDAYLMRTVVTFTTRDVLDTFLDALQVVINRHDIMRTALRWQGLPQPVQVVHRHAPLPVIHFDTAADEDALQALRDRTDTHHLRLDLQQAPLIAAHVTYDVANDQWLLALLDHHLISDNVTLRLIMREIQAVMDGQADALPPSQPYRNFIAQAATVSQAEHEVYFRKLLADVDSTTAPYGVLDVHGSGAGIQRSVQHLSDDISARVHQTARAQGVPTSVLFHAAWGLVVAATSGRDDGIFGTVLSGRSQGTTGADHALGMFINTLPMRIRLQQNSVRDVVQDAYQQLSGLLTHEQAPLALAQRCSAVDASLPLFTVILNCRHGDLVNTDGESVEEMDDQDGIHFLASETRTNYPIEIAVANEGPGFSLTAQSITGIDPQRIAAYLGQAVAELVNALEQDPARLAASLQVVPDAERQLLLNDFNATTDTFTPAEPIHALFEHQVRVNPDAVALVYEDCHLSYRQLNRRANHVASQLLTLGVQPDERVAICAERSLEMIVGLLGVLKSGAAYVPIDPAHPADRMAFMLQDSQPRALLAQRALSLPVGDIPLLTLDSAESLLAVDDQAFDANPVVNGLTPDNLAYVIYTSGSTGQSKGVMVEHRSVFNFWNVLARTTHQHCPTPATVALNAGFFFDMSIKGISQLFSGHKLVIIPQLIRASGSELLDFLEAHQVHAFDSTPSQLDTLLSAGLLERSSYQPVSVLLGGEAINASTWEKLRNCPTIRFYNMYGPTECTVDATIDLIRELGEKPSIGRPIANVQVHVLDAYGEPAPLGVAGEIHIGGSGVARGYLNRDELSAERFIADRFCAGANARLYKTGDMGRWLADGTLEYMGRNDFQVKVRGFRIELGEIENALLAIPGIREAVVIARNDSQGDSESQRLVAYVCGEPVSAEQLRSELLKHLPEYMVPSAFVSLDALPLTSNGKLDRRALPAPGQDSLASKAYEAPKGDTEEAIAEIWKALLRLDQVGRNDGFLELGGHSLLAVQLLSRLRRKLGTRITLRELFDAPTVRGLASLVNASAPSEAQSIPKANRSGRLPLSFSQQRLWFLDHLDHAAGAAYHLPMALQLTGTLDKAALQATLDRLVARHETLRTRFELVEGEPVQKIAPADTRFPLQQQDLRHLPSDERTATLNRLGQDNATQLFDLTTGPVLRGDLLQVADEEHVLLITLHHIVSDGWSNSVLAHEVSTLYSAFSQGLKDPLPALPLQYVDYAAWQRQSLDGPALQAQVDFWRTHLEGAPGLLNLPLDRQRPAIQSYTGGIVDCVFSPELSADLRAFSQAQGSTLFMVLLAGWSVLMTHLGGQHDVVVGTPVANRQRPELEPLIGFFANTLALRIATGRDTRLSDMLALIKDQTLAAYSHQDLPFEQVVSALQPTRSMSHSPLFQVMLSLDNTPPSVLQLPGLHVESLDSAHHTTQFDLSLSLVDSGERLGGSLQYASDLFDASTVQNIAQLFAKVLENLVTDARQSIGQVLDHTPTLPRSAHATLPAELVEQAPLDVLPYEAPQGETEIALANLWKELLKLETVSRHDDFFKLGGISLMAVQMASRLRKVLGKPIAVRDLFVEPTIAGFARTLDGQTRPGQHSNLVPIRRTGTQRPLFMVHPLGGEVQYVRDLAPVLDPQVPLYGLAASGRVAGEAPQFEVSGMASHYLAAIRQVQPQGPYRIGGWSAGGLIAYEMARQLLSSGEQVEFLGIIDTSTRPEQQTSESLSEGQFLMDWLSGPLDPEVRQRLNALAQADAIDAMLTLCITHRLLPEELPQDVDASLLRGHLAVAYAIRQAISAYVSTPAPVTVTLFTASGQERKDPLLGWGDLLETPVSVTALPGTHDTLVKAPHVEALGQAISLALKGGTVS